MSATEAVWWRRPGIWRRIANRSFHLLEGGLFVALYIAAMAIFWISIGRLAEALWR